MMILMIMTYDVVNVVAFVVDYQCLMMDDDDA